jgi:hypothetical protein
MVRCSRLGLVDQAILHSGELSPDVLIERDEDQPHVELSVGNVSRVTVVPVSPWAASARSMISSSAMGSRSWRPRVEEDVREDPSAVRCGLLRDALGAGLGEDAVEEGERVGGAPLRVRARGAVLEAVQLVYDDGHDELGPSAHADERSSSLKFRCP